MYVYGLSLRSPKITDLTHFFNFQNVIRFKPLIVLLFTFIQSFSFFFYYYNQILIFFIPQDCFLETHNLHAKAGQHKMCDRHVDKQEPYCVQLLTQLKQICKIFVHETYTQFSGYSFWVQKDFKYERIPFCFFHLFFFFTICRTSFFSALFW